MTDKKGVLFTGGEAPDPADLPPYLSPFLNAGVLVAADSGLDTALLWNCLPDFVVGDMDSLKERAFLKELPAQRIRKVSVNKDETDTELGLMLLQEQQIDKKLLIGGGEGRLDHTMALLSLFQTELAPAFWVTAKETIFKMSPGENLTLQGEADRLLSLFPIGRADQWHAFSDGLVWELHKATLHPEGGYSLSNRTEKESVVISVKQGEFLVLLPHDSRLTPCLTVD